MDNLSNLGTIKRLLARNGFSFSKALGQNFLINPTVCPKIAEQGNAMEGFGIIEIGTGIGVLTNELAKRAEKVVGIEIDERLLPILSETLAEHKNVKIISGDVMKIDLEQLIRAEFSGLSVAVCANLPYYITSPILMMLLEKRLPIKSITVMVQKEAATRLCAELGTREVGAVTVAVRYFSTPKLLFNVSRGSFLPAPNVDSAVIRLDINEQPTAPDVDEAFFFKVVRGAFGQRRKTLANSLAASLGLPKTAIFSAIAEAGLGENVRPEELLMKDFAAISKILSR